MKPIAWLACIVPVGRTDSSARTAELFSYRQLTVKSETAVPS